MGGGETRATDDIKRDVTDFEIRGPCRRAALDLVFYRMPAMEYEIMYTNRSKQSLEVKGSFCT